MEPTTPGNRSFIEGRFYNAITVLLAIVVTFNVSFAIVTHWKTYDWLGKFLGIALLLNLVVIPLTMIMKLSKGEKAKPDMVLQTAYIWLMLATMLFNR